jgi:hypothetical protein
MKVTDYMLTDVAQGGGVAAVAAVAAVPPVKSSFHDDPFHRTMSSEECTTFSWVRTTFPTSSSHFYGGQSKVLHNGASIHRQPQPHAHAHPHVPPSRPGYVASVRDDDVLLGRGRSHARRPANVRFRGELKRSLGRERSYLLPYLTHALSVYICSHY